MSAAAGAASLTLAEPEPVATAPVRFGRFETFDPHP